MTLNEIVECFAVEIEQFKDLAKQRYLSWKEHPEYFEALDKAFLALRSHAANFDPNIGRKLLEVVLETRLLHEELIESYKARNEFHGGLLTGYGQEAVGAGIAIATRADDVIARDHRSISAAIGRGATAYEFWTNHLMRATSPTGGYEPHVHFMDRKRNDLGFMISDMAMSAVITNGAVWYLNAKKVLEKGKDLEHHETSCGVAIFGDGAASNGLSHAGMNFAKAWKLPVLFVILNNQIACRTSPTEEYGGIELSNRGLSYEMPILKIDGDNVFEVYLASYLFLEFARLTNHPALINAITFRRSGHNESERTNYVENIFGKEFINSWMHPTKDPLYIARKTCEALGFLSESGYQELLKEKRGVIDQAHQRALKDPQPDPENFRNALIDPECQLVNSLATEHPAEKAEGIRKIRFREALQEGILEEFRQDPLLIMLGEDIGWPGGGVFEVTTPLVTKFPDLRKRIVNSTLDEAAIAGFIAGVGLMGGKAIGEYQFWNFFLSSPAPILTLAATRPFMQKIAIPGVIRGPTGYGPQSNHYHENWPETYLLKALGIKVVVPSTAEDFKGLFKSAVRDPDLVAFLEEMSTYGWTGEVPEKEYFTPFKAKIRKEGKDVTIITWGPKMLRLALDAAEIAAKDDIDTEVIDLRVLRPLDIETLFNSIRKTGRAAILYEDSKFMGFGAEIAAQITENPVFYKLKARIMRIASLDTPIPANLALEDYRLPDTDKVIRALKILMEES